jgi:putative hemolysin
VGGEETACPGAISDLSENPLYKAISKNIPDMAGSIGKTWWFQILAQPVIERIVGLPTFADMYTRAKWQYRDLPFTERYLRYLNIDFKVDESSLERIPKTGPLLVVSNHPYGIADGFTLLRILKKVRKDARIISTTVLGEVPEVGKSDEFILLDVHHGKTAEATEKNRRSLLTVVRALKKGQAIIVFPAGAVSRRLPETGEIGDLPWKPDFFHLAIRSGATILPVYVDGQNSFTFMAAARIHRTLATALLAREFLNKRNKTISTVIGDPLAPEELSTRYNTESSEEVNRLANDVRELAYQLKERL